MSKKLEEFSDEELEEELRQREARKSIPVENPHPDWSIVKTSAKEYINGLAENGRSPRDIEHYIFESVIEALYGQEVWENFINPILMR